MLRQETCSGNPHFLHRPSVCCLPVPSLLVFLRLKPNIMITQNYKTLQLYPLLSLLFHSCFWCSWLYFPVLRMSLLKFNKSKLIKCQLLFKACQPCVFLPPFFCPPSSLYFEQLSHSGNFRRSCLSFQSSVRILSALSKYVPYPWSSPFRIRGLMCCVLVLNLQFFGVFCNWCSYLWW